MAEVLYFHLYKMDYWKDTQVFLPLQQVSILGVVSVTTSVFRSWYFACLLTHHFLILVL